MQYLINEISRVYISIAQGIEFFAAFIRDTTIFKTSGENRNAASKTPRQPMDTKWHPTFLLDTVEILSSSRAYLATIPLRWPGQSQEPRAQNMGAT